MIKPFVKWAGGKTQILDKLLNFIPKKFNNYYEPFIGGGSLLFSLLPRNFYINDINSELVLAYKCFTKRESFDKLKSLLDLHANKHCDEYYYQIRNLDRQPEYKNLSDEEKAARIIYLNKACFNGLYRVNKNGFFNVPSGKKAKVNCYNKENYNSIFEYFSNVDYKITNLDFEDAIKDAKAGDLVYFDPPYDTLENKHSFTSYSNETFGKNEQIKLANVFKKLSKKGAYVILSNHKTDFVCNLYKDFNINIIKARRNINRNGKNRGDVEEVIITNFNKEVLCK